MTSLLGTPLDIELAFNSEPAPIDYVLPNMVSGTVGALISPGGTGKSMLALQLAIELTGGTDLLNLGDFSHNHGSVAYLAAEDPISVINQRLHALAQHLTIEQRAFIAQRLAIHSLVGSMPNILSHDWRNELIQLAKGRRLLILDTLRRFHIEEENASGPMSLVIGSMEHIAAETGCSIVFLHHANKTAAMSGAGDIQQASRGSSVLVDNIRWQGFLATMTESESATWGVEAPQRGYFVRFGISKANYGPPFNDRWFRRHEGGLLKPAILEPSKSKGGRRDEV